MRREMDYKSVLEDQIKRLEKKTEEIEKKIYVPAKEVCMVAKLVLDLADVHSKHAKISCIKSNEALIIFQLNNSTSCCLHRI